GGRLVRNPVLGQEEPERETGERPVAAEAAGHRAVGDLLLPEQPCVLRPRPGVEDQPGVAADQDHDVRGRVGPDAGKREQAALAPTMRWVADQVQFVVQIVFTTSSKTDGLRSIRPAPDTAQARSGSAATCA